MNTISSSSSSYTDATRVTRNRSISKETQIIPFEKPVIKTSQSVLVDHVKQWVQIEKELKQANEHIRTLRESKHALTKHICEWLNEKDMANRPIRVSDGELRFYEKKEYQPITFGYVEDSLGKIISDKKQVDFIMNYLRENREITVSKDIRRNYKNRSASFS